MTGTVVKRTSGLKSWGFLKPDGRGSADLFFHVSDSAHAPSRSSKGLKCQQSCLQQTAT